MKKMIAVGIVTILAFGLTGCSWFQPSEPTVEQPTVTEEPETTPTDITEPTEMEEAAIEESTATTTPNQVPGLIQPEDQPANMIYAPGADKL